MREKNFAIHEILHFKQKLAFEKLSSGKIWLLMYSFKICEQRYYNLEIVIFYGWKTLKKHSLLLKYHLLSVLLHKNIFFNTEHVHFFSIQLLIREIFFSRNLYFHAESSEIKILLKFSKKNFFCSRNRESFLPRNYLLAKFFYFKVIQTNPKRKLYQHKSKNN